MPPGVLLKWISELIEPVLQEFYFPPFDICLLSPDRVHYYKETKTPASWIIVFHSLSTVIFPYFIPKHLMVPRKGSWELVTGPRT